MSKYSIIIHPENKILDFNNDSEWNYWIDPTLNKRWLYFPPKELRSKDNANILIISSILLDRLMLLREFLKTPIIINSAYRTKSHNKKAQGKPNSYHLNGMAADIRTKFHSIEELTRISNNFFPFVKPYKTFVHVDVRNLSPRNY